MITLRFTFGGIEYVKQFYSKAEMMCWIEENKKYYNNFRIISAVRA